jgi:serine/threonine-protein kinase
VPDVVHESSSQALARLNSDGLNPSVKTNPNSTRPAGTVIRQNPTAGSKVAPNSTVTIVVSGGGVKVPNEIGQSLSAAENALSGDGLTYQISYVPATNGTAPNTVVGMNPKPGSVVARGDQITLQVAQSQPTTPPPSSSSPPASSSPPPTNSSSPSSPGL